MGALTTFLERRPLALALICAAIPYFGLRLYVSGVMHAEDAMVAVPGARVLIVLVGIGVAMPTVFLAVVLRRLVAEKDAFELRALLEVYFSVLLVFAVTYALLQSSAVGPAFVGMPSLWDSDLAVSAATHLESLHAVFGNALYLSVVTMTTVGFGDIAPVGFLAKAITGLQALLGIGFVGLVLGQYFSSCVACSAHDT